MELKTKLLIISFGIMVLIYVAIALVALVKRVRRL